MYYNGYGNGCYDSSRGYLYALVLVLFILLVLIGTLKS